MLAVAFDDALSEGDLSIVDEALVEGTGVGDLATLAFLSLFCDAPARPGDDVPPDAPRNGYWADVFDDGDVWGSRLWTLGRSKIVEETRRKAQTFASEALAWMKRDGLASQVVVTAEIRRLPGRPAHERAVFVEGQVFAPDGTSSVPFGPWEALRGV